MRIFSTVSVLGALLLFLATSNYAHAADDRTFELSASPGLGSQFSPVLVTFKYMPATAKLTFADPQVMAFEFGAQLTKHFAMGINGTYASASIADYDISMQSTAPDGTPMTLAQSGKVTGSLAVGTLDFMGYFQYPIGRVVPYVGAGIGIAAINLSDMTLHGKTSDADIFVYQDGAYALHDKFVMGVEWWFDKNFALDVRGVYSNSDTPSFRTLSAHVEDKEVLLGIKARF